MSKNAYDRRVHRVMDHVRRHLDSALSLDELAQVAHFSPYHFHRIFKATTGETLTRFTQRARLERACYLMKASPERELGSIALEVGFSAQSDFSRVFKRRYGIPPSAWDRASRLDDAGLAGHGELDDFEAALRRARAEGPEPQVRLVTHEACRLAYIRMRTPFLGPVLREGYDRLLQWLQARDVDWRQCRLLGLSWDHFETTPIDQVHFDFGFAVGADIEADGEVGIHEFPAVQAADVHCYGPLSRIAVAWDHLYNEWLPGSRFEPEDMPAIKRFRQRPDELGWQQWDLDCSIAVRPVRP